MPAIIGIALGIALGYAAGGRVGRVPEISTRVWVSLAVLSLAQGLARGRVFGAVPTPAGLVVWGFVSLAVCVVMFAQTDQPGINRSGVQGLSLVVLGTLLNVLVVLLNQGMPAAGVNGADAQISASGGFYVHLNDATILSWLGDVLMLNTGGTSVLLSVGDVLLLVGVATVIIDLMLSDCDAGPLPLTG